LVGVNIEALLASVTLEHSSNLWIRRRCTSIPTIKSKCLGEDILIWESDVHNVWGFRLEYEKLKAEDHDHN
jgi:hypothetical protein